MSNVRRPRLHCTQVRLKWPCLISGDVLNSFGLRKTNMHPNTDSVKIITTTLDNITTGMIGPKQSPMYSSKAGENASVLEILINLCEEHADKMEYGRQLLQAGKCLLRYVQTVRRAGRKLTDMEYKDGNLNNNKTFKTDPNLRIKTVPVL